MEEQLLPIESMNERRFLREDGLIRAEIYGQPIYFKKNGTLTPVDSFKLYKYAGEIRNGSQQFPVKVAGLQTRYEINGEIVTVSINGLYLDDQLLQEPNEVSPVYSRNEIFWEEIFDGVDIKMIVTPYLSREFIIFKRNILVGRPLDGEKISVRYDINGELKTKRPYAFDANGRHVPVIVDEISKGLPAKALYTYAYPITLDPTVSPISSSDAFLSNDVSNIVSIANYDYLNARTWQEYDCGIPYTVYEVSYMKFNLSSLASVNITSAALHIFKVSGGAAVSLKGIAEANEVDPEVDTGAWGSALYAPQLSIISAANNEWKVHDVLSHVKAHKGGSCDFGMTHGTAVLQRFRSTESIGPPYLEIVYSDAGGGYTFKPKFKALPFSIGV